VTPSFCLHPGTVARLLRAGGRALLHLGLTQTGQPTHPLYVP
jgi:hypothetical protein